jgi:hypothetical protein
VSMSRSSVLSATPLCDRRYAQYSFNSGGNVGAAGSFLQMGTLMSRDRSAQAQAWIAFRAES